MASKVAELVRLLHEVDGQLGLAVYRGQHDQQWKDEAKALITRIRAAIKDLEPDAHL